MWWRWTDVDAPAEVAWDLLVELDRWPDWGPTVAGATLDDGGRRLRAGATGRVRPAVGPALPFAVTAWEDGRAWSWRVAGVPATTHRVEPVDDRRCRVGMGVPVWAPAYLAVVAVALGRIARLAVGR